MSIHCKLNVVNLLVFWEQPSEWWQYIYFLLNAMHPGIFGCKKVVYI